MKEKKGAWPKKKKEKRMYTYIIRVFLYLGGDELNVYLLVISSIAGVPDDLMSTDSVYLGGEWEKGGGGGNVRRHVVESK